MPACVEILEVGTVEEALRRDLGLEDLEDVWARVRPAPEEEGLDLANDEIHATREERRAAGRS